MGMRYDVLDHTNHIFSESLSSGNDNDREEELQKDNTKTKTQTKTNINTERLLTLKGKKLYSCIYYSFKIISNGAGKA